MNPKAVRYILIGSTIFVIGLILTGTVFLTLGRSGGFVYFWNAFLIFLAQCVLVLVQCALVRVPLTFDESALALEVTGLNKRFGGLPAARNVSLKIMPGERRLIIGPNGAGKTTLFNLITGDLTANNGTIKLFGQDLVRISSELPGFWRSAIHKANTLLDLFSASINTTHAAIELRGGLTTQRRVHFGLARTYQILTLFPRETLEHNVVLALLGLDKQRWNPWSILTGHRHLYVRAHEALAQVGLADSAGRIVAETSYGERRRLEFAMALAQKPKVLLLDEPLAGLSQGERQTLRDLLTKIPRDVTIVMIEHDMDTALGFAEQITVLHYGEVIVEGTRAEVVADPRTREVYLGD